MAKRRDDPVDEMKQWGEKQYTPWEYAQKGEQLPVLKAAGSKKKAAVLFAVLAAVSLPALVLAVVQLSDGLGSWPPLLMTAAVFALYVTIAWRYLKKWQAGSRKKQIRKNKKKRRN